VNRNSQEHSAVPETLRIVGRYTTAGQIELRGDPGALSDLASLLTSNTQFSAYTLDIPQSLSPEPYDHFLTGLHIAKTSGAVEIKLQSNILVLAGSGENLTVLAQNIAWLANNPEPSGGIQRHIHIEYYPDPYGHYLAPASLPLIISAEASRS
jgi:hypothetical protein